MCFFLCSVKHQYDGEWSDDTRLTTCDPHAKKLVAGVDPPQEIEDKNEIIFTYDVEFQVNSYKNRDMKYEHKFKILFEALNWIDL